MFFDTYQEIQLIHVRDYCIESAVYTGNELTEGPFETFSDRETHKENSFHRNMPHSCS